MQILMPELVLDPMWLCQANYVDLEYYTYVLLDARKKYLSNLASGFGNFYEIVFHYLNLNTVIADKKMYDSHLNVNRSHKNLMVIVSQLSQKNDTVGKGIVKMVTSTLAEVMRKYLDKQINVLENLHFHFNNNSIHKEVMVYLVCKSKTVNEYRIFKMNMRSQTPLGYSISDAICVNLPNLKHSEFRERLMKENASFGDFVPGKNVMVVSGTDKINWQDGICLAKDTILLNRIVNPQHGFDANVMLDYNRLLEKKQAIPFKLKA